MSWAGAFLGFGLGLVAVAVTVLVLAVRAGARSQMPQSERNGAIALAAIMFVLGAALVGAVLGV